MARSGYTRMKGLIGRSEPSFCPGDGLWIVPCNSIHTIGMRFPIDAVYLGSGQEVVKLYHKLAPLRIAALAFRARSVLELPVGILEETQTEVGDVLEISPDKA